jgi:hypothetical protein
MGHTISGFKTYVKRNVVSGLSIEYAAPVNIAKIKNDSCVVYCKRLLYCKVNE